MQYPPLQKPDASRGEVFAGPGAGELLRVPRSGSIQPAQNPGSWLRRIAGNALLKAVGNLPIRLLLPDGSQVSGRDRIVATVKIRDDATLFKLLLYPELNFGNAYMDGSVEVEGDLLALLESRARAKARGDSYKAISRIVGRLRFCRSNTLDGSRTNIHHHYDLGNDFYQLWLDKEMLYTCAYFPSKDATLEEAQLAKLDHICRKLQLGSGDRVVEAGCGWGAFALHAAMRYGASVRAYSISKEQIAFARDRACALGMQNRVEFIEDDYRNASGECDAFVSIGMLEHVGEDYYDDFGDVIDRCLSDSGRGLIHSIGQHEPQPLNPWIEKRIFPGACPPTLRQIAGILEPRRLNILDVENLRPHYALTIEHWLKRFEEHRGEVREMYDESFVRAWRFYLSGSIAAFRTGELQLYQVLFQRPGLDDTPWTRAHLYRNAR